MTPREFFDLTALMRETQKEYFRTRDTTILRKSKELEKRVDDEISRVRRILNEKPAQAQEQTMDLFGTQTDEV